MRNLIFLLLFILLPFQQTEAQERIDTLVLAGVKYSENGNNGIQESIDYYRNIIEKGKDQNIELNALCLSQIGFLKYFIRELDSASYYLSRSKRISKQSSTPNYLRIVQQFNLALRIDYRNNNYEKSILNADSTIKYLLKIESQDSSLYSDLYYLKAASELMTKNYNESIVNSKISLSYITLPDSSNMWKYASLYNILGTSYSFLNNKFLTKKYFYESLRFYKPNNNSETLAATYIALARIHTFRGEFNLSIDNIKKAIRIYDLLSKKESHYYASWYNSLAISYHELKQADSAIKYYNKSIYHAIKFDYTTNLSNHFRNFAELYYDIDSIKKAKKYITKSLEEVAGTSIPSRANANKYAAEFYFITNNKAKGLVCLDKAMALYKKKYGNRNYFLAECMQIRSLYHYKMNDLTNALFHIQNALIINTEFFNDPNLESNPSPLDCFSDKFLYAHLIWKSKLLDEKIKQTDQEDLKIELLLIQRKAIVAAIKTANYRRSSFLNNEDKFWLTGKDKETYNLILKNSFYLVELTKDRNYIKLAYELSGKSKAGILSNLIREEKLKSYYNLPDSIIREDQRLNILKKNIGLSIYKESLSSSVNKSRIESLKDEMFNIEQKINSLKFFISHKYKNFNTTLLEMHPIPMDSIQMDLGLNQLLIEYYYFDKSIYAIAISRDNAEIKKIKINEDFEDELRTVNKYVRFSNPELTRDDLEKFESASKYLYTKLIDPFKTLINNKELIIIPDDQLLNLPFEILINPIESSKSINIPNYLLLSNPILYVYSSNLLNIHSKTNNNGRVIAFAPNYDYKGFTNSDELEIMPDLNHSNRELKQISKYFNTQTYIADSATINYFKKDINNYSIVHLAAHATIDDDDPSFSKLVFSPTSQVEYNLYLNQIYNINSSADLVVLSACNTGAGKIRKGEGVMSFARAFLYSGVQSLTLTLWSINDRSSADLMGNYYKFLADGYSKSKSLQQAKLKYLKTADPLKAHPYYWAAYVHIGNNEPIQMSKPYKLFILVSGILILISLSTLFIRKRIQIKKRKNFLIKKGE